MSFLAALDNRSPFAAFHAPLPDGSGREVVLIVVKASFEWGSDGALGLARAAQPHASPWFDRLSGLALLGMALALAAWQPPI